MGMKPFSVCGCTYETGPARSCPTGQQLYAEGQTALHRLSAMAETGGLQRRQDLNADQRRQVEDTLRAMAAYAEHIGISTPGEVELLIQDIRQQD